MPNRREIEAAERQSILLIIGGVILCVLCSVAASVAGRGLLWYQEPHIEYKYTAKVSAIGSAIVGVVLLLVELVMLLYRDYDGMEWIRTRPRKWHWLQVFFFIPFVLVSNGVGFGIGKRVGMKGGEAGVGHRWDSVFLFSIFGSFIFSLVAYITGIVYDHVVGMKFPVNVHQLTRM